MGKKQLSTAFAYVLLFSFFLFSCVDKSYDLSKDVDLTIEVGGDAFMIPLGYTENITLDKMIETTDVLKLDDDGLYSIRKSDNIDDVNVDVKEVNIKVDEPTFDGIIVDFEEKKVNDFNIEIPPSTADLNAPKIVVDVTLPARKMMNTPKEVIPGEIPGGQSFTTTVEVDDHTGFDFEYNKTSGWPEEVAMIKTVFIGDKGSELGQKVTFRVITSDLNNAIDISEQKIKSFTITFPVGIVLEKDNASAGVVNENKFTLTNHALTQPEEEFSFYVVKQELNATREQGIDIRSSINYHLEYDVAGTTKGSASGAELTVKMDNADFKFRKADVITNDIEAKMEPGEFKIESTIEGLEDIEKVNVVTFKDSKIVLNISKLNLPIGIKSGNVVVDFPSKFTLEKLSDNKEGAITYANNKLNIPAQSLSEAQVELALKQVTFGGGEGEEPVNGVIVLNEPVTYSLQENTPMILQGAVSTDKLDGLENLKMNIDVVAGLMQVDNSNVVTKAVTADVEDQSTFEVNESVDEALKVLKTVDWRDGKSPKINLKIDFPNFPTGITELKFVNLKINLPKFLTFAPGDKIENGVLTLNDEFVVANGYKKVLTVTGMDFSYMNNGAGLKTQVVDGETWLKIDTDNSVTIKGLVSTFGGETVDTDQLQNIKVQPTVSIEEMPVGKVTGTVDPVIDPVNESVSLDLGSDLDFLKEQGTNLDIANPQIYLTLSNTIGVPVDLTLNMKAMDADGKVIDGSLVPEQKIKLEPAVIDGEPITTKILLSRKKMAMPENKVDTIYKNVVIEDLSNLMKVVPDKVDFNLIAKASGTDHHIDLSKEMKISGNYKVIVPFEFKAIDINYKDTIDNLREDLSDVSDKIVSAEMKILGDISNTVPVDLHISVNPLDANGNKLEGVETEIMTFRVVDGASVPNKNEKGEYIISASVEEDAPTLTKISIGLKSQGGDLKQLESLELIVHASATETANGVALRSKQYVKLSKMYIKVKKVNLNLND